MVGKQPKRRLKDPVPERENVYEVARRAAIRAFGDPAGNQNFPCRNLNLGQRSTTRRVWCGLAFPKEPEDCIIFAEYADDQQC